VKTIIHLTLSDLERDHLSTLWYERSTLVSRNEVTQKVQDYIQDELRRSQNGQAYAVHDTNERRDKPTGNDTIKVEESGESAGRTNLDGVCHEEEQRGAQDYLAVPTAARLTTACRLVIQHIEENQADDTLNLGWCASILLQTGIE